MIDQISGEQSVDSECGLVLVNKLNEVISEVNNIEAKLQSAPPINNAMNAISLKAKAFVPKVKNGMDSWTIHNIRDILTTVAETAS